PDGYGRHALSVYQGIVQSGCAEATLRESWITSTWVEHIDAGILSLAQASYRKLPAKVAVAFTLPYDPRGYDTQSLIHIWITQFETDHMPERHVEKINKADHLIVTSKWQEAMMKRSGVAIPISSMVAGVDTDYFAYRE